MEGEGPGREKGKDGRRIKKGWKTEEKGERQGKMLRSQGEDQTKDLLEGGGR